MEVARSLGSDKTLLPSSSSSSSASSAGKTAAVQTDRDTAEEANLLLDAALTLCSLAAKSVRQLQLFYFTL